MSRQARSSRGSNGITSFGGSVVLADPPADIRLDTWESNTEARLWLEQQTMLTTILAVDAINAGTFQDGTEAISGNISASTQVISYMLRVDPVAEEQHTYEGFVIFDQPILGVMFLKDTLDNSDGNLARPGVLYNHNSFRGLELSGAEPELLTVSDDRFRVDFTFTTGGYTDDIRIITTPEPSSLLLLAIVASSVLHGRRHRW